MQSIIQGQYKIGGRVAGWPEGDSITTVLGSCVSACLYDAVAGIGGMNHFMLPEGGANPVNPASYGAHAMELLINGLIKAGADKRRLNAKVFGAATMLQGSFSVGARNASFVRGFLRDEGIHCVTESLGGKRARRIEFQPLTGAVTQKITNDAPESDRPVGQTSRYTSSVELF